MNNKGTGQTMRVNRMICVFGVRIYGTNRLSRDMVQNQDGAVGIVDNNLLNNDTRLTHCKSYQKHYNRTLKAPN